MCINLTLNICVPFISQMSRAKQNHELPALQEWPKILVTVLEDNVLSVVTIRKIS